jgi:TonB family protein
MTLIVESAIRCAALVLTGLIVTALIRRQPAAVRHCVLSAALLAGAGVMPLGRVLPPWHVTLPEAVDHAAQGHVVATVSGATAADEAESWTPARLRLCIIVLWGAGTTIVLFGLALGFWRLRRISRGSVGVDDARWMVIAADVAAQLHLARRTAILHAPVPLVATFGVWRPVVIVPEASRDWSDARIRIVLAHEFAHVVRHDWVVQVSAEILRALYWFNPLLWTACARLRRESEHACDDAVVRTGVPPVEYAAQLIELARMTGGSTPSWALAMRIARTSTLHGRIDMLLTPNRNRSGLSRRAVALVGAGMLALTWPIAAAQTTRQTSMTLSGEVYDMTGAALPQVQLTLIKNPEHLVASGNPQTGAATFALPAGPASETFSDAAGHFEFPAVAPGDYTIEAAVAGFRPLHYTVSLQRDRDWHQSISLQVGEVKETISVQASRIASRQSPITAPAPIRVGGKIKPPTRINDVQPIYPASMREAGIEGVVPMEAVIARDGSVQSLRVLSAQVHPDLAMAAMDAVRQWRFEPTLLNGRPVEVMMTVSIKFTLAD